MKTRSSAAAPFHALVDFDLARAGMRDALGAVLRHAAKAGWRTTILPGGALNHGGFDGRSFAAFAEPVGGVIAEYERASAIRWAHARGIPAVALFPDGNRTAWDEACGEAAAEHLFSRGFGAFAFAGSGGGEIWSESRRRGFERALAARGVRPEPPLPPPRRVPARGAGDPGPRLEAWLRILPRPIAVYVAEDGLARRLAEVCDRLGLRIPADIAVLGTGNDEILCRSMRPALSSVCLDFDALGAASAAALEEAVAGRAARAQPVAGAVRLRARASTAAAVAAKSRKRPNLLVRRCLDSMKERIGDPLPVAALAAELGVSRRTLETRFRAETGRTVAAARLDLRLERARSLLASTALPLDEIAARCGFYDAAHLAHASRRRLGVPPAAFRSRPDRPLRPLRPERGLC